MEVDESDLPSQPIQEYESFEDMEGSSFETEESQTMRKRKNATPEFLTPTIHTPGTVNNTSPFGGSVPLIMNGHYDRKEGVAPQRNYFSTIRNSFYGVFVYSFAVVIWSYNR